MTILNNFSTKRRFAWSVVGIEEECKLNVLICKYVLH